MMNLYHKKAKIVIDFTRDRMRNRILANDIACVYVHVLKNYSRERTRWLLCVVFDHTP